MKTFEEIYKKVFDTCNVEIEVARKKVKKDSLKVQLIALILFVIIYSLIVFSGNFSFQSFSLMLFIIIIATIPLRLITELFVKQDYNKLYKDTVIKTLVREYDSSLNYNKNSSIPAYIYKEAQFERYDNFYSDDLIYGKLENKIPIQLGDVRTEDVSTDSDGNTTTTTIFRGLFSKVTLSQNINSIIKIRSDKGLMGKFLKNKELMQMDSQEFEKKFDVYTQNKILAMQILTSDILDYMLTFKKENKVNFELTLKNQELYIRIHCQNMFEATSIRKNPLDKKVINMYYQYLDFMCELNKKFYHVVEEKNL